MPKSPLEGNYRSTLAAVVDWCFDRIEHRTAPQWPHGERDNMDEVQPAVRPAQASAISDRPRCFFGGDLLFRRMQMLDIDREQLAKDDPLLLYELRGLCSLCRSKEECAQDCARESDAARWDRWQEYCPNATTLMTLGAVQNCGLAAQHLKTPAATGLLQTPEVRLLAG